MSLRQGVGAQQQHDPHDFVGERLSHACRMGENQSFLQSLELVVGDADARQIAESRVDAIDRRPAGHRSLEGGAPRRDPPAGGGGQLDRSPALCDGRQVGELQTASVEFDRVGQNSTFGGVAAPGVAVK